MSDDGSGATDTIVLVNDLDTNTPDCPVGSSDQWCVDHPELAGSNGGPLDMEDVSGRSQPASDHSFMLRLFVGSGEARKIVTIEASQRCWDEDNNWANNPDFGIDCRL